MHTKTTTKNWGKMVLIQNHQQHVSACAIRTYKLNRTWKKERNSLLIQQDKHMYFVSMSNNKVFFQVCNTIRPLSVQWKKKSIHIVTNIANFCIIKIGCISICVEWHIFCVGKAWHLFCVGKAWVEIGH